jgi:multicomponent Na+:H+ antiporter subunit E
MRQSAMVGREVLGHFLVRVLVMGGLWVVLVGGDLRAPALAVGTVVAAAAAATALRGPHPWRLRPGGALRFVPLFLWMSVVGGFDVAQRAFRFKPPLAPSLMPFQLRLDAGTPPATFFVNLISLLPGTLCAEVRGAHLRLHVVDRNQPVEARLRSLEAAVAAMFGVSATAPPMSSS